MTKDIRLNARINADLQRKLRELSDTLGINQSAVLTVAINRLHQQEIATMTAQTQTAITVKTIVTKPEADPYHRDTRGISHTVLWLDPRDRTCGVSQEYRTNSTSSDVWHNRVLEFSVSDYPTEDVMREWIEERMADLVAICDGHEVEWDGSNQVGRLTEDARAIRKSLEFELDNGSLREYYEYWSVEDWTDSMTGDIAADTTDEDLRRMAQEAITALDSNQVLDEDEDGVYSYFARIRQDRIDELD